MRKTEFTKELKAELNAIWAEKAEEKSELTGKEIKPVYFTEKDAKDVIDAIAGIVYEALPTEDVTIFDGLTLSTSTREPRVGRNPQTGEKMTIKAQRYPKAKFGRALKDAVSLD